MKVKKLLLRWLGGVEAPLTEQPQLQEPVIVEQPPVDETPEQIAAMRASAEPWVMVVGVAEEGERLKLQLDWNEAFVQYLMENGITGHGEDEIVAKWVSMLDQKVLLGLEDEAQ